MDVVKNAVISPLEGSMDLFSGGIFDSNGNFLEDSVPALRGKAPQYTRPEQFLKGVYIYGGCLFAHFGHFIWESLARLAAIRRCHAYPILFISPNSHIFSTQKNFFKTIGIKNEIKLIKTTSEVENLIYSAPESSISPLYITARQFDSLAYFDFTQDNEEKKIWLSRSQLKGGRITNEIYIEKILKKIGYRIVYPEQLTLFEQVKLISTSKVVAGFEGSQFSSAIFSKKIYGKFIIFNRRPGFPEPHKYIFDNKKINYEIFELKIEYASGDKSKANANYILLEPEKIVDILISPSI